jgi:cytochrome c biogenesis protein CcmG/thiol:disulfide interchange protein DsbE
VLISILAAAAAATGAAASNAVVGEAAPDFQVTTLDGTKPTLHDFKNQVLVLNFWATWCVPCRTELPLLDRYYRLQQLAGLRALAVTTEASAPLSQLKPLAATLNIRMVRRFKGDYAPLNGIPTVCHCSGRHPALRQGRRPDIG